MYKDPLSGKETTIPMFEPWLDWRERDRLEGCILRNWITGGPLVKEFETRMKILTGAKHAIACMNGTMAIVVGLHASGLKRGDEVIVPDFTFVATANAALLLGARVRFVDVDETMNMSKDALLKMLLSSTAGVRRFLLPVHIYGRCANMAGIMSMARDYCTAVVEDAAQGIGVTQMGRHTGTFGKAGCISFYSDKTMTTSEGGMILTNDDDVADRCVYALNQGRLHRGEYVHPEVGWNFRMTDLQAAVGLGQLDKLEDIIRYKRVHEEAYRAKLAGVVAFPPFDAHEDVPFRHNILVEDPASLQAYLKENGVASTRFFKPLHTQPCYQGRSDVKVRGQYPGADWSYQRGLSLPSSARITEGQIDYICERVQEWASEYRNREAEVQHSGANA